MTTKTTETPTPSAPPAEASNPAEPSYPHRPVPPWAVRYLIGVLQVKGIHFTQTWDPFAGHLSLYNTLAALGYQASVSEKYASLRMGMDTQYDIDYADPNYMPQQNGIHSVITSPPPVKEKYIVEGKVKSMDVVCLAARKALYNASQVVALLVPTSYLTNKDMPDRRPNIVLLFEDRLNIHKDTLDKKKGRVDYCWMIWADKATLPQAFISDQTELFWINAAARTNNEKEEDYS